MQELGMREVMHGHSAYIDEVGKTVCRPLWTPLALVEFIVPLDEWKSNWFEKSGRHTLENLKEGNC